MLSALFYVLKILSTANPSRFYSDVSYLQRYDMPDLGYPNSGDPAMSSNGVFYQSGHNNTMYDDLLQPVNNIIAPVEVISPEEAVTNHLISPEEAAINHLISPEEAANLGLFSDEIWERMPWDELMEMARLNDNLRSATEQTERLISTQQNTTEYKIPRVGDQKRGAISGKEPKRLQKSTAVIGRSEKPTDLLMKDSPVKSDSSNQNSKNILGNNENHQNDDDSGSSDESINEIQDESTNLKSKTMIVSLKSQKDYENLILFFTEFFKGNDLPVDLFLDSPHESTVSENFASYSTKTQKLDQKTLDLLLNQIKAGSGFFKVPQKKTLISAGVNYNPNCCDADYLSGIPFKEKRKLARTITKILKLIRNHCNLKEDALLFNESIWRLIEDTFVELINTCESLNVCKNRDQCSLYILNLCDVLDKMSTVLKKVSLDSHIASNEKQIEEAWGALNDIFNKEKWICGLRSFWHYFFRGRLDVSKRKYENFQKYQSNLLLFLRMKLILCVLQNIRDALYYVRVMNSCVDSPELAVLILLTQCDYEKIRRYQIERFCDQ